MPGFVLTAESHAALDAAFVGRQFYLNYISLFRNIKGIPLARVLHTTIGQRVDVQSTVFHTDPLTQIYIAESPLTFPFSSIRLLKLGHSLPTLRRNFHIRG